MPKIGSRTVLDGEALLKVPSAARPSPPLPRI
jgi:hypothetical protein